MDRYRFLGTWLLSVFVSAVFALFVLVGLNLVLDSGPPYTQILGVPLAVRQAAGGGLALFGMFGLLFARGVAVLLEIERSLRKIPGSEEPGLSLAYQIGRLIGKAATGGKHE